MISRIAVRTILALALVAIGGCVSTTPASYPSQWPPLTVPSASGCGYAEGVYSNPKPAEAVPPEFAHPLVVWFAGRYPGIAQSNFAELQILTPDDALVVRARRSPADPWEPVPVEKWKCVEGRLVGPPLKPLGGEGHATWHIGGTVTLERDSSGALVMHVQQSDTYQSMVFLFNEKSEAWVRYDQAGP